MTENIQLPLSEDILKKLEFVANFQGKDMESVAGLAIRLYLQHFTELFQDMMEDNGQ